MNASVSLPATAGQRDRYRVEPHPFHPRLRHVVIDEDALEEFFRMAAGTDVQELEYVPFMRFALADLLAARADPVDDRPRLLKLFEQVCQAVAYAHSRSVVHRDLKPANVKVKDDGTVKVLDFGLAAVAQPAPEDGADGETAATLTLSPTRAGTILGTAPYMSPEQAVGRIVDARTDIFSLGAVLYELITNRRAFMGSTVGETVNNVVNHAPEPLGLENPAYTPELDRIVFKCLVASPTMRPMARKARCFGRRARTELDPHA